MLLRQVFTPNNLIQSRLQNLAEMRTVVIVGSHGRRLNICNHSDSLLSPFHPCHQLLNGLQSLNQIELTDGT